MRPTTSIVCILTCPLMAVGCYYPPDNSEQFDDSVIVTSKDQTADFTQYATYFIRPEIRVLDEELLNSGVVDQEILPSDTAAPLLQQTENQLQARGYRPAASKDVADLAVELDYARNIYSDYYCYYWSDWYYWGYPGYYYYYPYSCDTVAWRSGMLVTNLIDIKGVVPVAPPPATSAANAVLRGLWFSGVYGVEAESSDFVAARAVQGIDQAFKQSPYISTTAEGQPPSQAVLPEQPAP
jgi:uncharacterized protein DUF4136